MSKQPSLEKYTVRCHGRHLETPKENKALNKHHRKTRTAGKQEARETG